MVTGRLRAKFLQSFQELKESITQAPLKGSDNEKDVWCSHVHVRETPRLWPLSPLRAFTVLLRTSGLSTQPSRGVPT